MHISSGQYQGSLNMKRVNKTSSSDEPAGNTELKALFPGKVIKVVAEKGKTYEKDALLLVMESMKMEYQYKAPKKINIHEILVEAAQTVSKDEEFFQYEFIE